MKYFLLVILLFQTSLFAQEEVKHSFSYIQLEPKNYTFDEIKEKSEKGLFVPLEKNHSKFGFTHKIFWIKVELKNNTEQTIQQILELNYPALDTIDIYSLEDEKFVLKKELGDHRPYDKKTFMPTHSYTFKLLPLEAKTFFIKVVSESSMNIGISVQSIQDYLTTSTTQIKWLSFYFGAILIMLMYNFIIYLITKNRSFLYYVLFHISYISFALAISGIAFELFWPDTPSLNQYILPIAMPLTGTFAVLFSIHFLNLKILTPKLAAFLYALALFTLCIALLPFIVDYSTSIKVGSLITFFGTIILFLIALYLALFKKNINALFYFIAWSFFLIGVAISHLSNIGIVPSTTLTGFASQIGSFFEVLLLSIGLAYYYNRLQKEHLVLSNDNHKLRTLSQTDTLTDCYNRRYFYNKIGEYFTETKRSKRKGALLMLDLDHFKKVNDKYGHGIGDEVLISFVNICKSLIRKDDILARFGGEEFVIFLPYADKLRAFTLAQNIKTKLSNTVIVVEDNLTITVSIGISINTFEVEALLKESDKALYKAKASGRNTIIFYEDI